jgi:hypothetical protein
MKKALLFCIGILVGAAAVKFFPARSQNDWSAIADRGGVHRPSVYSLQYREDTLLTVTDPANRSLRIDAPGVGGLRLFDGEKPVLDLALEGFKWRGTVEGRSVELRPGAQIVLETKSARVKHETDMAAALKE